MNPRAAAHLALNLTLSRLNWSPADLAPHCGCAERTVQRWASGDSAVNILAIDRTRQFRLLFSAEYERLLMIPEGVAANDNAVERAA